MNGHDPLLPDDRDAELHDRTRRALGRLREIAPGATADLTRVEDERRRSPLLAIAAALVVLGGVAGMIHLSGRSPSAGVAEGPSRTTVELPTISTALAPATSAPAEWRQTDTGALATGTTAAPSGPTVPPTIAPAGAQSTASTPTTAPPAVAWPSDAPDVTAPASAEPATTMAPTTTTTTGGQAVRPLADGVATTLASSPFTAPPFDTTIPVEIDLATLIAGSVAVSGPVTATSAELNAAFVDRGVCDRYADLSVLDDAVVVGHATPVDALVAVVRALGDVPVAGYVEVATDSGMVGYFAGLGADQPLDAAVVEAAVLVERRSNGTWSVTEAVVGQGTAGCPA